MARVIQYPTPPAEEMQVYDFPAGFSGGIDISKSADLIAQNKSPNMVNVNYDGGGIPTKRYGFDLLYESHTTNDIRGIYEYTTAGGTAQKVIFISGALLAFTGDFATIVALESAGADAVTDAFIFGNKLYFLTGSGYKVFDGTTVSDVVGYAPTVLIGKKPDGTGGTADEEFNLLSDSWKESFSGTAGDTDYVLTFPCDSIVEVKVGGTVVGADTYALQADKVTVKFNSAPGEGTDNVVIAATEDGLMDTTVITKCSFHSIYGGLNDTRVFLSGNADYKNATFHSGLNDPTYFPESGLVYHGSDAEAVRGMARVADYHLTFKERQIYYTDVDLSTTTVLFPTKPMNDEFGCASWRTVKPAQGGAIALSYDGVIWTVPSSVRGQLNTVMISKEINKGVGEVDGILEETRTSLESAWAEVFENKYYLHVNDKCWVLDLNYSSLSEGVACWYPYDGLYANFTCMMEGSNDYLYAGATDGNIYKSNAEYSDAGIAIDAWWTSPMIFGDVTRYKKFLYLNCSFGSEASATQNIYVYTEEDLSEDSEALVDASAFDFDDIDFDNWTFGSNPYSLPVTIWFKTKGWFVYWKWRNNQLNQGMTIHSQVLFYINGKKVK